MNAPTSNQKRKRNPRMTKKWTQALTLRKPNNSKTELFENRIIYSLEHGCFWPSIVCKQANPEAALKSFDLDKTGTAKIFPLDPQIQSLYCAVSPGYPPPPTGRAKGSKTTFPESRVLCRTFHFSERCRSDNLKIQNTLPISIMLNGTSSKI